MLARCSIGPDGADDVIRDAALAAARGRAVVLVWCDELDQLADGLAPLVAALPAESRAVCARALRKLSGDPGAAGAALADVLSEVAIHRDVVVCFADVDRGGARARAVVEALLADRPPATVLLSTRDPANVALPAWVERVYHASP